MKHKNIDLASEVKRASLPDGLNGFLFPLYEAISNFLHSIEERWQDDLEINGRIDIDIDIDRRRVTVCDNGNGFDENNLTAFLTPMTGNKFERGGKGFGRFIAFKVFKKVRYSSKQKTSDNAISSGRYTYDPFSKDDNLIEIERDQDLAPHTYDCGLTVEMSEPNTEYENYFYLEGAERGFSHSPEEIYSAIVDHFLVNFVQKKIPKHFTIRLGGAPFDLYSYFYGSLTSAGTKTIELLISDKQTPFAFTYFKVLESKLRKHRLYFYANNRAASDLENISPGLNDGPFTETRDEGEVRYYYLVAVSSDFFKSSQSRDRITNLYGKIDFDGRKKSIKDHLIAAAKSHILEIESAYTNARRSKMREQVEHLISIDPVLRRGLGNSTVEDFVQRRSITESREQLAQDLFIERMRKKFDFSKLDENTSLETLVSIVKSKIPEDAKEALAVYVAYRNHVIKIFRELLNKSDTGLATEDRVHQLIYPRYKDSEEVDYSSHNLWLLDDDLAYARYVSSDRTPEGATRGKGDFAHDILINAKGELMIVEMKRPQKKGYDSTKEANTNNPVDQLKKQIADIRKRKKVTSSKGREIEVSETEMVRGFILADWNTNLETYLRNEDFIITNFGGKMAYKYFHALNMIIEVLAFDRLVDRASNRNEAFVQMLEGRSNYDRTTTSPFESKEEAGQTA